jgi:hypothetical protein
MQYFDRDVSIVPQIVGAKHRRHAAGAQLALDAVFIG